MLTLILLVIVIQFVLYSGPPGMFILQMIMMIFVEKSFSCKNFLIAIVMSFLFTPVWMSFGGFYLLDKHLALGFLHHKIYKIQILGRSLLSIIYPIIKYLREEYSNIHLHAR